MQGQMGKKESRKHIFFGSVNVEATTSALDREEHDRQSEDRPSFFSSFVVPTSAGFDQKHLGSHAIQKPGHESTFLQYWEECEIPAS